MNSVVDKKMIKGDELEILSATSSFNKTLIIDQIIDEEGNEVEEVKRVKQRVYVKTDLPLQKGDILRKKL